MSQPPIHILLVEDDYTDADLIQRSLKWNNSTLEIQWLDDSSNLMPHLHACQRGESPLPDLLIMDIKMPKQSGCDLLQELRSSPPLDTLPIAVLSSSAMDEDLTRMRKLGVDEYFIKPVELQELRKTIQRILTRWGLA